MQWKILKFTVLTVLLLHMYLQLAEGLEQTLQHSLQEMVNLQDTLKEQLEKVMINYPHSDPHIIVLTPVCRSSRRVHVLYCFMSLTLARSYNCSHSTILSRLIL